MFSAPKVSPSAATRHCTSTNGGRRPAADEPGGTHGSAQSCTPSTGSSPPAR